MTHKEMAKKLGISPSTLSLIINHKPGISDNTRKRVLKELSDMGYDSLSKIRPSSSKNICFAIYRKDGSILDNHLFDYQLLASHTKRAKELGYNTLLVNIDKNDDPVKQFEYLYTLDCCGIVLFSMEMSSEDFVPFTELSIPVVSLGNFVGRIPFSSVSPNNELGAYQAVEYLAECGHSKVGYLQCVSRIPLFQNRKFYFLSALHEFQVNFSESNLITLRYTEEASYQDFKDYLATHSRSDLPDAYVCDDDTIAIGALRALTESGYRVPKDISLIGFEDRPGSSQIQPPLTTIHVSRDAMAVSAVDELIRLINLPADTDGFPRTIKYLSDTSLIIRDSVKVILP